jgi:hypothetical protein
MGPEHVAGMWRGGRAVPPDSPTLVRLGAPRAARSPSFTAPLDREGCNPSSAMKPS